MHSPAVVDAIRSLHLREGQVVEIEVDGRKVQIALKPSPPPLELPGEIDPGYADGPAYLLPWFDLSNGVRGTPAEAQPGTEIPFDPPIITDEDREGSL